MNGLIDIIYSKRDTNEWTDRYNIVRETPMNGLIYIIYSKRDTNEWTDRYNI